MQETHDAIYSYTLSFISSFCLVNLIFFIKKSTLILLEVCFMLIFVTGLFSHNMIIYLNCMLKKIDTPITTCLCFFREDNIYLAFFKFHKHEAEIISEPANMFK